MLCNDKEKENENENHGNQKSLHGWNFEREQAQANCTKIPTNV
jgi:hypothetical protein